MITRLPEIKEATELVEFSEKGKSFQLDADALKAWRAMREQALKESVSMYLISAFRSIRRQHEIIESKKQRGLSEAAIYKVNAPAGFSEHHSGKAIDIGTENYPDLEEVFAESPTFKWLSENAVNFDSRLSYPANNPYGIAYEPWHWLYIG